MLPYDIIVARQLRHSFLLPNALRFLPQAAAKAIKEVMDKKCGTSWHVIIGEGFDFEVTYEVKSLLWMFFASFGVLCFKSN